ncbi:YkgJ family cysteine cluster protein [Thermoproteota archaeon]
MDCNEFDSKKNNETKKYLLNSGIPCTIHSCFKCCVDTHMPLTGIDIKRISKQGYRYKDFVIRRKRERYLKNHNGKCFFLEDNGCKIYFFRPDGCHLYPLVYNENTSKAVIHDFCPYGNMFKVSRDDVENLLSFIKNLDK